MRLSKELTTLIERRNKIARLKKNSGGTRAKRVAPNSAVTVCNSQTLKTKICAFEHGEQVALVQWLTLKGIRFSATPNGGKRNKVVAIKLKAEGVSAGFPDLTIFPDEPHQPILFIEMKRKTGGRLQPEQREWLEYFDSLAEKGFPVRAACCEGFEAARGFILGYGY